jgi:hypothetical protein
MYHFDNLMCILKKYQFENIEKSLFSNLRQDVSF